LIFAICEKNNRCSSVLKGARTDESRDILGFAYASLEDVWNSCDDVSEGKAASGVSATSYGDSAFLAFQENGPNDTSHVIYISEYKDGKWLPQEAVAGQASADPPQLSILNGRINCIFNSNDETKDLKWYSRSLLDFSLSTWMSGIPDETLLSNITLPGTHDSCAESNIPFVRTQYLSITKQLEAGLRFLDLRVRVHSDGQLYMYHGGESQLPGVQSLWGNIQQLLEHSAPENTSKQYADSGFLGRNPDQLPDVSQVRQSDERG
jgi:1-phosphatidylinositol phosphodiesterase